MPVAQSTSREALLEDASQLRLALYQKDAGPCLIGSESGGKPCGTATDDGHVIAFPHEPSLLPAAASASQACANACASESDPVTKP